MARNYKGETFNSLPTEVTSFLNWIETSIDCGRCQRLLDLGCGTGTLTRALKDKWKHLEICGIDISPESIEIAQNTDDRILYICDNFTETDFEKPFDVIIADSVLHLVDSKESKFYDHLQRNLTPEGQLIASLPRSCWQNTCINSVRSALSCIRCPLTDYCVYLTLKLIYGKRFEDAFLKERVPYAYWRPFRQFGDAMNLALEKGGLQLIRTKRPEQPSLKPQHIYAKWAKL